MGGAYQQYLTYGSWIYNDSLLNNVVSKSSDVGEDKNVSILALHTIRRHKQSGVRLIVSQVHDIYTLPLPAHRLRT